MELLAGIPEWLVWCAAGAAGFVALRVIVNLIESALDLEAQ